ncbi:glycosyltransferase family 2 protein [Companilactobacillus huachuanensis]|uniref:Glycosyltransferase family 2 protein n=1 Tax=Companilactobacillus huachuanensis TaxID=2559914 RepID=A0ABW1RNA8_9LACO|nr:glycosyltransferase family 2 protein [Companilactobacillus huachuanensis]
MKIDAVVVTFNRLEKLKECLDTLITFDLNNIFVIDNASTDGTKEYLKKVSQIQSITLEENIGGAGGFNIGMKQFIENSDSEYLWIMDDDTIPEPGALELLSKSFVDNSKIGFAIGQVYWTDGTLAKMNLPVLARNQPVDSRIRCIEEASFVAVMFSRQAIEKSGYPISEFFIWGDDVEYTNRIVKQGFLGVQVMEARILHKMGENVGINILDENSNQSRVKRYFYNYRNRLYLNRKKGVVAVLRALCGRVIWGFRIMFSKNEFKRLKLSILCKGTLAGLTFNPKIEKC